MHVDQLEPEPGDPLQESLEGALIWQLGSQRGGARAHADLAVVEFRAQHPACLHWEERAAVELGGDAAAGRDLLAVG